MSVYWCARTSAASAASLVLSVALLISSQSAQAQFFQEGEKLVGSGAAQRANQGHSLALSADGNTLIVGGYDNNGVGAAWVFTRSGNVWTQQGATLVGSGAVGRLGSSEGFSVALSADGNTAVMGGPADEEFTGAAWVFTRSGDIWTQQGKKLVGSGAVDVGVGQGTSVALSADGNSLIVGGEGDNHGVGAAWVFTRSSGVWTQQGPKLVGSGAAGVAHQGTSVALSADGSTAIVGGNFDGVVAKAYEGSFNWEFTDRGAAGAAWVFTSSGNVWTQQGAKLVGTGAVGDAHQGTSVALSADGSTAIIGGWADADLALGAVWVFVRSGGVWRQQGKKLVGSGAVEGTAGAGHQGTSVALSADGNTAVVGGPLDNDVGAAWVFTRSGDIWTQQGAKLVGSGAARFPGEGTSVALSADGSTLTVGGPGDNQGFGAVWMFRKSEPGASETTREAEEARRARQAAEQRSWIEAAKRKLRDALVAAAPPTRADKSDQQDFAVQAIGLWERPKGPNNLLPTMFIDIRSKQINFSNRAIRLFCADDGVGEVLAEVDGQFYAVDGWSKGVADKSALWVVVNRSRKMVLNGERHEDIRSLGRDWSTIATVRNEICPSAQGPIRGNVDRTLRALNRGRETYRREAARLGLEPQPQSYDLPARGSAAYEQEIVGPARAVCEILAKMVSSDERQQFLAGCFPDSVKSCEQFYLERGFC